MHFEVEIVLLRTFGSKEMWEGAHPPKCDSTKPLRNGRFCYICNANALLRRCFFMPQARRKTAKTHGGKEMQRKFLEDLGLEKEVIDKIMTENSNDIKKIAVERDGCKEQLETAQTALKEFEGIDVKELNGKIKQLTDDLAAKDTEYQTKIADMEFNSVLDSAIAGVKAKNSKAVKALLDLEALKSSKNQSEDIKSALEKVKSENDYLFDGNSVPGGGGNPPDETNNNNKPLPSGTVIF